MINSTDNSRRDFTVNATHRITGKPLLDLLDNLNSWHQKDSFEWREVTVECADKYIARLTYQNVSGVLAIKGIKLTQIFVNQTRHSAGILRNGKDHKSINVLK